MQSGPNSEVDSQANPGANPFVLGALPQTWDVALLVLLFAL